MAALLSLLVLIVLSLLVTRVAAVALTHTGLSRESATFQARSAFSGVGYTTIESEAIVTHPVRRRIVMLLMLLGNASFIAVLAALVLTFVGTSAGAGVTRFVVLALGLLVVWALARNATVDQRLSRLIDRALRRYTRLDVRDYAGLLHVHGHHRVAVLHVREDDWLAGKRLSEARLRDEGVLLLGIERPDGHYVGAPLAHTCIHAGDQLVVYGRDAALADLDQRRKGWYGDVAHSRAVAEQRALESSEPTEEDATGVRSEEPAR